ncbi:MAG: ATPase component BioM of energizing module of biotin ECF transporter [uncultured Sulfurovum sp.]|uniref:ATPase component BioM of energizing module of biotin ECF transporter n=1 Tax=uncultured Sulfurovum sp. TaxID=269237 RepID=A0A6S6U6K7_9BACT|nr:MAG: ATPase component BioM of energizing module of biotin ECF transporter [uncultured Sulfurovum sp.]
MLTKLLENSALYINLVETPRKRYFYDEIDHVDKLIGIIGARGVGKTTYILNYLKNNSLSLSKKFYLSADNIVLSNSSLLEIAKEFAAKGGELLAIDEIHKYKNFEIELKQIYDMLPLKVIFSGSSAIELEHAKADLSRRAVIYRVNGLSFREFLEFKKGIQLDSYSLDDILTEHTDIAFEIVKKIKPLEFWEEYLEYGYYPFYFENPNRYSIKLNETINTAIEVDIPSIFKIKYEYIINLKKLVKLICSSEPFTLNIQELSSKIGIDRDTLYLYFEYLDRGKIFNVIRAKSKGDNIFSKPDKIYLNNPNLNYSYCNHATIGMIRETIFTTFLKTNHDLSIPKKGDFLVDEEYLFEIGGKNKSFKQIKDIPNSYVVADDIEVGFGNKVPLWLFGFLY